MAITPAEIAETRDMVSEQHLDIRTITMGISLMGCATRTSTACAPRSTDRITRRPSSWCPPQRLSSASTASPS